MSVNHTSKVNFWSVAPFHGLADRLRSHGLLLFLLLVFAFVLLRTAWLAEDAFITFRTIDNFINGYGLRWNVDERVQTYTHPLWLLLISLLSFLTREVPHTALFLSLLCSLGAVYMLSFRLTCSVAVSALALGLCLSSKAFVDFSTSGLENPLTHVLVAAFVLLYRRPISEQRALLYLSLVTALAVVNRMDIGVLLAPGLAAACWQRRSVLTLRYMALGFLPFVAWEAFSLVYYGFLVPNTAYAKLNTGIPLGELVERGIWYLENSLRWDPPTLTAMVLVCAWSFFRGARRDWSLVFGALLYVVYVVRIGGDFMSGRFFSAPFFLLLCVLVGSARPSMRVVGVLLVGLLSVHFAMPRSSLLSDSTYGRIEELEYVEDRISDERETFYPSTGLLPLLLGIVEENDWAKRGRTVREYGTDYGHYFKYEGYVVERAASGRIVTTWISIGLSGFYAGPDVYIVDALAISDPLLARLPAHQDSLWSAGHFGRIMPIGYIETHISGKNNIEDRDLSIYFTALKKIISGDLMSATRWTEIWRFHTGYYDAFIDWSFYRFPSELDKCLSDTRIRPGDPSCQLKLAEALFGAGEDKRALEAIVRGLGANPSSKLNMEYAGKMYFENEYYQEANGVYEAVIELSDASRDPIWLAGLYGKRGVILFKLGRLQEAEEAFVQAANLLRTYGNHWEVMLNIVSVRMRQNNLEGGVDALREAISGGAPSGRLRVLVEYVESRDSYSAQTLYRQMLDEMSLSEQERGEIQQRLRLLD